MYSEFKFADRESSPGNLREMSSRVPRSVPFVSTGTPSGNMTSHLLDSRPEKVQFLNPEMLYIDLTRVSAKELQSALGRHAMFRD